MSDSDNNVVFLSFASPHVVRDDNTTVFHSCRECRNKTFTLTEDAAAGFPLMRCAACGFRIGRMGWAHDDLFPPPPSAA